jgi:hypothetical protein
VAAEQDDLAGHVRIRIRHESRFLFERAKR